MKTYINFGNMGKSNYAISYIQRKLDRLKQRFPNDDGVEIEVKLKSINRTRATLPDLFQTTLKVNNLKGGSVFIKSQNEDFFTTVNDAFQKFHRNIQKKKRSRRVKRRFEELSAA